MLVCVTPVKNLERDKINNIKISILNSFEKEYRLICEIKL
jgi:hypothetical protein